MTVAAHLETVHVARTFHQEWPEQIPGGEHGDVECALTRQEWERRGA